MKPRLMFSELTGSVYVVTRYATRPHPTKPDREIIIAQRKYDVTEDALAMAPKLRRLARSTKGTDRP